MQFTTGKICFCQIFTNIYGTKTKSVSKSSITQDVFDVVKVLFKNNRCQIFLKIIKFSCIIININKYFCDFYVVKNSTKHTPYNT